jgi:hypothetical protein
MHLQEHAIPRDRTNVNISRGLGECRRVNAQRSIARRQTVGQLSLQGPISLAPHAARLRVEIDEPELRDP